MNKMKKLLSVVLAVVLALSAFSIMGSAARTAYKTVDELTALDAYSPYGQVTRLSTEERTSIVFDALDNLLPTLNINMGEVFNVLGLSVTIDLTSVDRLCYSFDTIKDTFESTLASIAMGIVNLGILESLETGKWVTGMSRDGTANYTILSTILAFLSDNTNLVGKVFTDGLDLGLVSLGDMSAIEDIIMDLPSLVKGLVFPLIERWDDTLSLIQTYDSRSKGNGNVENTVNERVKKLFSDNMSITTVKYDVNGTMTSEHKGMPFSTSAPGTPSSDSPRCVYVINGTTPGSTLTVYHIVDAEEAKALAEDTDPNNDAAAYTYVAEKQTYTMTQEVPGSETYVWKATDEWNNVWSLKWYNDESQLLPGISGNDFDLTTMSAGDLLYTFIPHVFREMAPVVLNGSVKKALAEFVGVDFAYVGQGGPEADDAVMALADSSDAFFTQEQGEYVWEWSDYKVINGNHYYRFENQIFAGSLDNVNNYFDIINWDFKVTGDFMNEFIPADASNAGTRILQNVTKFLNKVGNLVLLPSAETDDTRTDYTATWTRPTFADGNENLVNNIKALAQAVVGLAPQHIFGDDWATNERCYVDLMLSDDNDTILVGIAAHLVNMIMPSMSLPGKSDILASGAKVGAILAAVVREFQISLVPEYNFDALIYKTYENGTKTFVDGKDSEYWFDVILSMGINVGFEYLRAFADMGEGTAEWNAFVEYSGYAPNGKTYPAGMTTAELNAHWEGMLDYVIDWALTTNKEWCWKMGNIAQVDMSTVDLSSAQDPFVKIEAALGAILPIEEILTVTPTNGEAKIEHWLREDLILGIVNLKWDHLIDTIQFNGPKNYFRQANVIDQLASLLKRIVNSLLYKVGNNYSLIPDAITDFDSLANQSNLVTMVKALVGVLHTAGVTKGGCDTLLPFLNFLLGWKTDPQVIADPVMWTEFRDNNDYAFQYNVGAGGAIDAETTKIKILNNSAGMLETHRNTSVTDHAYDINIKSVTSDATTNKLTFTYDNVVSPYEQVDIKIGGTFNGNEAVTVTIEYDYVGKDGQPVGGTQYTTISFLVSNLYEDSNLSTCQANDHDKDYTGLTDVKGYVFTEDLYNTAVNYEAEIHYVSASGSNPDKSFASCQPEGYSADCNGNVTSEGKVPSGRAANYFAQYKGQAGGWADKLQKEGTTSTRAKLYYALDGVTADTFKPAGTTDEAIATDPIYGAYDMGEIGVKYGSDTKVIIVDFIYYNDFNIYDIYTENKDNGYHANQGVDAELYQAYNDAWKWIVYGATFPMMTTSRSTANWEGVTASGTAENDYVTAIQPHIPGVIAQFEAAKEAYETALAEAQASGSAAKLPESVANLEAELAKDDNNGEKEINFRDYDFYEYFNYADLRTAHRNFVNTYYAPEVMDTYYILNSGIREAELMNVIANETNPVKSAAIDASKLENDPEAIAASMTALEEWTMPVNSDLLVEDMASRLAYYRSFVNDSVKEDVETMKVYLNKEILFVEAQNLNEADYEENSWENYWTAYQKAKAVYAGQETFEGEPTYATFVSSAFDAKYNLMVAYKNLLKKSDSLIEAGGTADLLANIEKAEAIFAMNMDEIELSEVALEKGLEKEQALGHLIEALGYYYEGEDGNTWNLYANSAYEYADNDRPNRQSNQAKVDACNANLEACLAYFATEASAPVLGGIETGVVDFENGYVYGVTAGESDLTLFFTVENGTFEMVANDAGYTNGTGATLVVKDTKGNEVAYFTLVVFGDTNGDGTITAADAGDIKAAALGGEFAMEAYAFAADVNGDASVTAADAGDVKAAALGGDITVNPHAA